MVDGRGDPLLGEVREERLGIAPARLQLRVLRLGDPEGVHVELAAAFQVHGELHGKEALREVREPHRALDRVVVGERDEVHSAKARPLVHLERV